MVLVDTPVWFELLRVDRPKAFAAEELQALIERGEVLLAGPIRQELLSGARDTRQLAVLRAALRAFPDVPLCTPDFEAAAEMSNRCRLQGICGCFTDLLLCAVATRLDVPIFTLDADFHHYSALLRVKLHAP